MKFSITTAILFSIFSNQTFSQNELSLASILQLEVPGSLIRKKNGITPASITTISSEDIAVTPVRNIYDLLEVYVPGVSWVNHWEGPHIGMRGIIVDRNYKFLLVVNGKVMNSKAHTGARTELSMWDLSDIEKVVVVRGPGSVAYGPGAIQGVISITTKSFSKDKKGVSSINYIAGYRSKGANVSFEHETNLYKNYSFVSVQKTKGYRGLKGFKYQSDTVYGYIGNERFTNSSSKPLENYLVDRDSGFPQVKAFSEFEFSKNLKLDLRYTQQTNHENIPNSQSIFKGKNTDNALLSDQQFTLGLENKFQLDGIASIQSNFYFQSTNVKDREVAIDSCSSEKLFSDCDTRQHYSTDEFLIRSTANMDWQDRYFLAFGLEVLREKTGAAWGRPNNSIIIGDGRLIKHPNTNHWRGLGANDRTTNDGYYFSQLSLFSEFLAEFDQKLNVTASVRMDDSDYTPAYFYPRLGITSTWDHGIWKLIGQESIRINTTSQLYGNSISGVGNEDPEKMYGLELSYDSHRTSIGKFSASSFFYSLDVIGWNSSAAAGSISGSTGSIGKHKVWGAELEYSIDLLSNLNSFVNHSIYKQSSWKLSQGTTRSGISNSDYEEYVSGTKLAGTGEDIANIPTQVTKFIFNYSPFEKLKLHSNMQVFWKRQGDLDGLEMLRKRAESTGDSDAIAAIKAAESKNAYKTDFRFNLSATYSFNQNFDLMLYGLNLIRVNKSKRYSYNSGVSTSYPNKTQWIEEPSAFGTKLTYKF